MRQPPTTDAAGRLAVAVLVALVLVSPWPFGSAHPATTAVIVTVAAVTALGALAWRFADRTVALPRAALPLFGLWLLAFVQTLPVPPALARLVAPGPSAAWHPAEPLAAAVLGTGPHPVSIVPEATLRWLAFSAAVLGLALMASPGLRCRALQLRSSLVVVCGALLVAVYGLVARLVFGDRLYGVLTVPTIAPFGPFVSKNHFAGYVEMAACLALGLAFGLADEAAHRAERLSWLESRRAPVIVATLGAAAALGLAVAVSLSRGGVVSLAAGLLAFGAVRLSTATRPPPKRWRVAGAVATAVVLATVAAGTAFVLPEDARDRLRTLGDVERAGAYRLPAWRDSLRLAASSPLVGSGLGAFGDALPRFKTAAGDLRIEHAENDYLELLAEGGLLGSALAVAAIALGGVAAAQHLRRERDRLSRGLRAGALAGLAALAVHSAFDFNLRIPSNALLAAFLLACVLAPSDVDAASNGPALRPPHGRARTFAGGGLLGAALVSALAVLALVPWSERRLDEGALRRAVPGAAPLRTGSVEAAVVSVLRQRPADASAWLALAWLRQPHSSAEAAALAGWAVDLDPLNAGLRAAAEKLSRPATSK